MTPIPKPSSVVADWVLTIPEDERRDVGTAYTLCNETNKEVVLRQLTTRIHEQPTGSLSALPAHIERVHLGFSAQFNYDIIAVTQPSYALIFDINTQMLEYYEHFKECICSSPTRHDFIARIQPFIDERYKVDFICEPNRPFSWLSSDARYSFVQTMYATERVFHRCINAAGASLELLAEHKPDSVVIDTIYASNIYEWLEQEGFEKRDQFKKNMRCLLKDHGTFIDARYLTQEQKESGPPLRSGSDLPKYATEKKTKRR